MKRSSRSGDYDLLLTEIHSKGVKVCICGYEMVAKYTGNKDAKDIWLKARDSDLVAS